MLNMIKSICTVGRCYHLDDQVVTESPSTGGWRRGVSAGVWVSECSGLTQPRLTPSLCRTQGSRDGVGGAGCHWALSWAKCPNAVHLRPFPHLDYFQLRFIADDKKILISRLMTTLARAEHHSIQFQIPGRGKFQGDTHRALRSATVNLNNC